jgi:Tol biopolymer transport system component
MKGKIIVLLTMILPFIASAQPAIGTLHLVTKEESLGKLHPDIQPNTMTLDPGFQHVAYVVKRGEKELAVVDGVEGKEYDNISDHCKMVFSPDGKRFAYVATRGKKVLVVADGKEGKEYDHIDWSPIFSPDSRHLAYIATLEDNESLKARLGFYNLKDFIVEDGAEGKPYQLAEGPIFSPDSKQLAYGAQTVWNREACIVVNGVESKHYVYAWRTVFSNDGRHFAFVADSHNPDRNFAVIDGKEGREYEGVTSVGDVIFSPDSQHTAYRVLHRLQSFVVRDNVPETTYDVIGDSPTFSPDGKRLAYLALRGTNWMMIVDNKIFDDRNIVQYTHPPVFSPDCKHLTYMTMMDTNWLLVADGAIDAQSTNIFSEPVYSPDGKRLIYLKENDGKTFVAFGEFESKSYDEFLTCNPSVNTKGSLGMTRDPFALEKDGTLHAMVLRDNELIRLELQLAGE